MADASDRYPFQKTVARMAGPDDSVEECHKTRGKLSVPEGEKPATSHGMEARATSSPERDRRVQPERGRM